MKKVLLISAFGVLGLASCHKSGGGRYEAINRQKAIFVMDTETGEMFMMEVKGEKGVGVVGAEWKKMGSPKNAK